jgi:hypothetical protein
MLHEVDDKTLIGSEFLGSKNEDSFMTGSINKRIFIYDPINYKPRLPK